MAFKILSGLPVISFAAITSRPVIHIGCFEERKFHPKCRVRILRAANFARTGRTSSQGSTSANQRSPFQNSGRKQSSRVARSIISIAPLVKSAKSRLSAQSISRQLSRLLMAGNWEKKSTYVTGSGVRVMLHSARPAAKLCAAMPLIRSGMLNFSCGGFIPIAEK